VYRRTSRGATLKLASGNCKVKLTSGLLLGMFHRLQLQQAATWPSVDSVTVFLE
jgi:hypothetical protein